MKRVRLKKKKLRKRPIEPLMDVPLKDFVWIELNGREYEVQRQVAIYIRNLVQENYSLSTRIPGFKASLEAIEYPKVRS